MSHRTRIAALERRLAPANAIPLLIRITGGFPDADPMRTTVGGQELEREADETLRTFEARVAAVVAAVAAGNLTPEEGQAVAAMLEVQRRGIELADHERRLEALEARTREDEQ